MPGNEIPPDRIVARVAELDAEISDVERRLGALTGRLDDQTAGEAARLVLHLKALRGERKIIAEPSGA